MCLKQEHPYNYQIQGQLAVSRLRWCDFFVWVGPQKTHLERIHANDTFWLERLLPSLQGFYREHAVPYLLAHNWPVAQPTLPKADGSTQDHNNGGAEKPLSDMERRLAPDQCQSRIDGRNGSSACTVIAALFVRELLRSADEFCLSTARLCRLMMNGNNVYDSLHTVDLLSADEVLDIQPSPGITLCQESFVLPTDAALTAMVTVMSEQALSSDQGVFGGIFVLTPYSFSMCCMQDKFVLIDSHSHGTFGALLAVVPLPRAVDYLKFFFSQHYPQLRFNVSNDNHPAAHMTYLSLL